MNPNFFLNQGKQKSTPDLTTKYKALSCIEVTTHFEFGINCVKQKGSDEPFCCLQMGFTFKLKFQGKTVLKKKNLLTLFEFVLDTHKQIVYIMVPAMPFKFFTLVEQNSSYVMARLQFLLQKWKRTLRGNMSSLASSRERKKWKYTVIINNEYQPKPRFNYTLKAIGNSLKTMPLDFLFLLKNPCFS